MALVYALFAKSDPDEMRYIGKTANFTPKSRLHGHIYEAKKSSKQTYKLNWIRKVLNQNDKVLAIILEDNLTEQESFQRESFLIDHYKELGHRLTNATLGGEGTSGWKHSEESKEKMRIASTGQIVSEETKAKLRAIRATEEYKEKQRIAQTGKKHSEETKASLSAARTGRVISEETKAKIRVTLTGHTVSDETRAKIGAISAGRVTSEETKAKQSVSHTGRKHTAESNAKNSAAHMGHKVSEETKAKLRENKLKYWEQKRKAA